MSRSENGWEPLHAGADILNWVRIPGAEHVSLQFMKGWPTTILRAYAADFHAYIEPLRDADSASFTPTNSVATSNHLNGTAMDLNWNSHPFRVDYAGFDAAKIARMRDLLKFYNFKGVQIVFWAQDWNSPKDAMHHQMGYNTWGNPVVQEFINERIRPDGFSTYKRGATAPPPPPADNRDDILARATGLSVDRAREILPAVIAGLRDSQCTTLRRVQYWLAQIGHESGSFKYTEEIQSGDESTDRWRYKGRTWIQITWRSNYEGLSRWAFGKGLIPSPTYFVDNPKKLAEIQYAGLGPAWYWVVARPNINAMCDAGDFRGVTQAINGGQNGAADRQARLQRAAAVGDQLLALISNAPPAQGEDELSAEAERMIREIYDEWGRAKQGPTRSFFGTDMGSVDSPLGFLYNIDGNVWNQEVTWGYLLGVQKAEEFVNHVAQYGVAPQSWAGSLPDKWLTEWGQQWCQGLIGLRAAMQKAFKAAGAAPAQLVAPEPTAPQVVYVDRPAAVPAPVETGGSTGQMIGRAYDALQELRLADALPIEDRAPLAALISVLQTKNGSELK